MLFGRENVTVLHTEAQESYQIFKEIFSEKEASESVL